MSANTIRISRKVPGVRQERKRIILLRWSPSVYSGKTRFQKLLKAFDKRYTLSSQKYFSQTSLPRLCTSLKEKVKQELSAASFFSATTDLWSSIGLKPFISYTIHFINSNWELCSHCIQIQYIPEDHTGDNIGEALKSTSHSWDLDVSNQVCLTTVSGTNMIKAAEDLGWVRLSCFSHNLHLADTKAESADRISVRDEIGERALCIDCKTSISCHVGITCTAL